MKVILVILVTVPLTMFQGFVLAKLWGWFAVPQFGVAPLRFAVAIGLSVLAHAMTSGSSPNYRNKATGQLLESEIDWCAAILSPAVTLFIGWIIHLCA